MPNYISSSEGFFRLSNDPVEAKIQEEIVRNSTPEEIKNYGFNKDNPVVIEDYQQINEEIIKPEPVQLVESTPLYHAEPVSTLVEPTESDN